jgi:hypothetical protein
MVSAPIKVASMDFVLPAIDVPAKKCKDTKEPCFTIEDHSVSELELRKNCGGSDGHVDA